MSNKKSRPEVNTATKLISRVIRYMLHYYKYLFLLVVVCILITATATVVGATFPQTLVDDYITPMLAQGILAAWQKIWCSWLVLWRWV